MLERLSEKFWESSLLDKIMKFGLLIIGCYFLYFFVVAIIKIIKL